MTFKTCGLPAKGTFPILTKRGRGRSRRRSRRCTPHLRPPSGCPSAGRPHREAWGAFRARSWLARTSKSLFRSREILRRDRDAASGAHRCPGNQITAHSLARLLTVGQHQHLRRKRDSKSLSRPMLSQIIGHHFRKSQWGSSSGRWCYWSQMIDCCLLNCQ